MKWATAFIAFRAVGRFAGSDIFLFLILGLRSQSLAPPQALCLRPLSRAKARLLLSLRALIVSCATLPSTLALELVL